MSGDSRIHIVQLMDEYDEMEKKVCNLPLIFSETFKDEINANDEQELYQGIKKMIRTYGDKPEVLTVMNEFTRVLTGGAALDEILLIAKEEAETPSLATEINVDDHCKLN